MSFAVLAILAFVAASPSPTPSESPRPVCAHAEVALSNDIESAHARAGEPFQFRTVDATIAPDGTVVPADSLGYGLIAIAQHAQRGGRGGYVVLETRFIALANGTHVPATVDWSAAANASATGASRNAPGIMGAVPFVGYVLGPYGFLHHGSDVTIARGTHLAVLLGDDDAMGTCRRPTPAPSTSPSPKP